MRASDALPGAVARLRAAGVAAPADDARALLAHALGVAPARLALHLPEPLPQAAADRFAAAVAARAARQPVAQIVGRRTFWGRDFAVTPDVLDPRPETEALVAAALELPFGRVLDLGTGSGAILVSLLAERAGATGVGTDISRAALAVAQANARAAGVAGRAEFVCADWFDGLPAGLFEGRFDLIVSNPPYIAAAEMAGLAPEVRGWEPHLALTPGGDGLAPLRAIAAGAGAWLEPGGRLLVEIGAAQGPAARAALAGAGFAAVDVLPDLDRRDRVVAGVWPAGR